MDKVYHGTNGGNNTLFVVDYKDELSEEDIGTMYSVWAGPFGQAIRQYFEWMRAHGVTRWEASGLNIEIKEFVEGGE